MLCFFIVLFGYLLIRKKILGFPLGSSQLSFSWYPEGKVDVSKLVMSAKIFFYYFKTLLLPVKLSFECKLKPSLSWRDWQIWHTLSTIILLLVIGAFSWCRLPWLSLCFFWFFLSLLPVSNLARQIGIKELVMEHYLYFPSIGFCLALAMGIVMTREKFREKGSRLAKNLVRALFIGILFIYTLLTWQRNPSWKNEKTIWTDAVNKAPTRKESNPGISRGN